MNLKNAARKAVETLLEYHVSFANPDPLPVLQKMPNVALVAYSMDEMPVLADSNQEAFTLVNRIGGGLKYIVIYNRSLPAHRLRLVLAKELAHVVLQHDKHSPEHIWAEESSCFAHHFLCPMPLADPFVLMKKRINYRPHHESLLWSMKMIRNFDNIDEMKRFIANERNCYLKAIGKKKACYHKEDVEFVHPSDYDQITGWRNCYDIVLDGQTVGYCGE